MATQRDPGKRQSIAIFVPEGVDHIINIRPTRLVISIGTGLVSGNIRHVPATQQTTTVVRHRTSCRVVSWRTLDFRQVEVKSIKTCLCIGFSHRHCPLCPPALSSSLSTGSEIRLHNIMMAKEILHNKQNILRHTRHSDKASRVSSGHTRVVSVWWMVSGGGGEGGGAD